MKRLLSITLTIIMTLSMCAIDVSAATGNSTPDTASAVACGAAIDVAIESDSESISQAWFIFTPSTTDTYQLEVTNPLRDKTSATVFGSLKNARRWTNSLATAAWTTGSTGKAMTTVDLEAGTTYYIAVACYEIDHFYEEVFDEKGNFVEEICNTDRNHRLIIRDSSNIVANDSDSDSGNDNSGNDDSGSTDPGQPAVGDTGATGGDSSGANTGAGDNNGDIDNAGGAGDNGNAGDSSNTGDAAGSGDAGGSDNAGNDGSDNGNDGVGFGIGNPGAPAAGGDEGNGDGEVKDQDPEPEPHKHDLVTTKSGEYVITTCKDETCTYKKTTLSLKKPTFTLSKGKKAFTIKLKKSGLTPTGYQIQYSLKKNMSKSKKVTVGKVKSKKIKKLKKKKTYYVRVRAYKKYNGKTYYSSWTSVKKIKTK